MMCCDETDRTPIYGEPCRGWLEEGWPWHGCTLNPGHDPRHRYVTHRCRCGHEWDTRRRA